jgi:L-2,4-diaminobutyric acid acetyltransferase
VNLRSPTERDGARVWHLLGRTGGLERNTCYAYVLLFSDFGDTCLVAEQDGELLGFVLAYRPPARRDELFVWQIGVAPEARGTGLGTRLLDAALQQPACAGVMYLTATVSPDNEASRRTFAALARRRGVPFEIEPRFGSALFAQPHLDEEQVRIGPLHQGQTSGDH